MVQHPAIEVPGLLFLDLMGVRRAAGFVMGSLLG
jgi:hypothetical protein